MEDNCSGTWRMVTRDQNKVMDGPKEDALVLD